MSDGALKQKAVTGVVWSSLQRFSQIFVSFISGIVLARLLSPEDYGLIGMLSIFMLLSSTFIDGGFGAALIQKKRPTQDDYSTVFFWNLGLSFFLYFLLFVSAPYIAAFYHVELLSKVLRVQGVVLVINALQAVQLNLLNKNFKFKKKAIVLTITSIISLAVTILLAYKGWGVWALVAQNILLAFIPTVIFWLSSTWWPQLRFSINSLKELFGFGFYILLLNLVSTAANNVQGLLIGRVYNPTTMGYYSKGHSTEMIASGTISQIISQVTFPLYAELQDDFEVLIAAIKKITTVIAYLTFPLMFVLILLAKPIFIILYSEKWLDSVPYFQMLCLAGLAACLQSINNQVIAAIGKSRAMFNWGLFKHLAGCLLLIIGLILDGMRGLLIGMVTRSWLTYIVNASLVSKYVGYTLWRQLKDLSPIMGISILSFVVSYLAGRILAVNMYVIAIVEIILFSLCYFCGSLFFKIGALPYVVDILKPYIKRFTSFFNINCNENDKQREI